jgi:hypothetical protein
MISSGTAYLPLHYGKVPPWLYERMRKIGLSIIELILAEEGTGGVLSRLSSPYWFQAMGCVMGMDWHSSGITTSVLGALKQAVNPHSRELGIHICGGRGRSSRKTPEEIDSFASMVGADPAPLSYASRLSAKIDNTCIDDGFSLYLHAFVFDRQGSWSVVQQGMNTQTRMARRYHWHSEGLESFVDNPHTAITGPQQRIILNLAHRQSAEARASIIDFIGQHPDRQVKELAALGFPVTRNLQLDLFMPDHHEVRPSDVDAGRLGAVLALAHETGITDFPEALLVKGVGPRTVQALSLVSEVVYGKPCRFRDPARFSFAHGGKDGHPFPVPLKTYDQSISFLSKAINEARIGSSEKQTAFKRLSEMSQEIEQQYSPRADVNKTIEHERDLSSSLGGKTCFD